MFRDSDKKTDRYDPDAFKDPCMLPFPLCGKLKNKLADPTNKSVLVRGIESLWLFAASETDFIRQYAITMDVWHFDIGWQNTVLMVIILGTFAFALGYDTRAWFLLRMEKLENFG